MTMRNILLDAGLDFDSARARAFSEDILLRILGIVCRQNLRFLLDNPNTPLLYDSGVTYAYPDQMTRKIKDSDMKQLVAVLQRMGLESDEVAVMCRYVLGIEVFRDIHALYKKGKGDCDNLVCARVAELWRAGFRATPYLVPSPNDDGGWTYHAIVKHGDGSAEDPSLILGMGGEEMREPRLAQIRQNAERYQNFTVAAETLFNSGETGGVVGVRALQAQIDSAGFLPTVRNARGRRVFRDPYKRGALQVRPGRAA